MENIQIVEKKQNLPESVKTAFVDKALHKIVSRKLLVWTTATVAMFFGMVSSENWVDVCLVYIGTEAAVNAVVALRGRGK